jgi:hypothetical protein
MNDELNPGNFSKMSLADKYSFLIDKQKRIGYKNMTKDELLKIKEIRAVKEPIEAEIAMLEDRILELKQKLDSSS